MADVACWWQSRPGLRRFVSDLVEDELVRQRRCGLARQQPWSEDLALEQDLGVDSLELMALATALAGALHLHESGIEDYLLARRSLGDWVDIAQAGLDRFSAQLTFRTSGSSGVPKPCSHALASLLQESSQHARLFAGRRRILSAVASHHIYGFLFNLLLPRALGLDSDAVCDIRGSSPAWLARGAQPGDLVVGHPAFWQALGRTVPLMPPDVVGVTSTAPCPEDVSQAVEAAGIARLFHIYGSSETAGIGWRDCWRQPYRLFDHWSFSADRPDELLRHGPGPGQLRVGCQDRLERSGDGTFRVGARLDDAVQVGGINVFPSRIASVLCRHPGVAVATVRLMRPDEGNRLKAFVVPTAQVRDGPLFLIELNRWIGSQLAVPERPKAIRLGDRLPAAASGKLSDWEIDAEADWTAPI